jgi:hypothetical protein
MSYDSLEVIARFFLRGNSTKATNGHFEEFFQLEEFARSDIFCIQKINQIEKNTKYTGEKNKSKIQNTDYAHALDTARCAFLSSSLCVVPIKSSVASLLTIAVPAFYLWFILFG